jgi:septation ring formation regulator EzrA
MAEKAGEVKLVTSELLRRVNEGSRRIRLLEQRMDRVDDSIGGLEENVLTQLDDLKLGIERLSDKILKISERLNSIDGEIDKVNKVLDKAATKSEVKQLETFVDVVNPITSKFVTAEQLDRVLEERGMKSKRA